MGRKLGLLIVLVLGCSGNGAGDPARTDSDATPLPTPDGPLGDADGSLGADARLAPDASTDDMATDAKSDVSSTLDAADATGKPVDVTSEAIPDANGVDVIESSTVTDGRTADRCRSGFYGTSASAIIVPIAKYAAQADASDALDDAKGDALGDAADQADADETDADLDTVCWGLKAEWRMFAQQNDACTTAADCMVVEGTRGCDCGLIGNLGQGIGDGSGTGIASAARDQAQTYIDRWRIAGCEHWNGWCVPDARPAYVAQCRQGRCGADAPSCNMPPPTPEPCY